MSIQTFVKSLISMPTRRRPIRRSPPTSRLCVEALEDRCLLSFSPVASYAAGTNNPQSVITADFNGDGRPDLAVADYSSNNVSVLLGNANGTFQPAQVTGFVTRVHSLAVGDFNADGNLDLATVNDYDVSVLLGNGLGSFGAGTSHYVNGTPASVTVGDFNADGKPDLGVTSNYEYYDEYRPNITAYANVLLGTGTGSFAQAIVSPIDYGYHHSIAVADFNGDGKLDFASVNLDYEYVNVLLGTGTGAFGGPASFTADASPNSVAADNVNADGMVDLVATNANGNVSVLLGIGQGFFGAAQNYAAGSQLTDLAMADFNGDGTIDLVMANWNTGTVSVLLGTGAGAFKPPVSVAAGSYPGSVAVGDFNGDGRPDVASDRFYSSNVAVLLNDGIWPAMDAPSLSINDVTVTEGNLGTVNATFTVSLSAASGQPVSIHYDTVNGNAAAGSDYQATSGHLTFIPGGPLTQTVTVPVNGDRIAEFYSETFFLVLTDPTNAFVADASGTGTILDDEPFVSIVDYITSPEGNSGTTTFTFTVTLSGTYDVPVTVDYATADFTLEEEDAYGPGATADVDYTATSGTVTFAAGQTSKTFTVLVTGDRLVESDEAFFVNLSNPTSALILNAGQAFGIIVDDERYVYIGDAGTVVEGNSGTKVMTFTVTLSAASDAPVTVTYATDNGTATAGSDYQAATGTVTFAAGETSKPITILINGDRVGESVEYFYVRLTDWTGAHFGYGTGSGTIQDDEPRISIGDVTKVEGKNRTTTLFTFTVTLSAAYDQAVTMSFRTVDGTATSGSGDYIAKTGTLTFAPGETTKTITIEVKGDSKKEADETFYLDLFGNSSNSLFAKNRGIGTILNDD